MASVWGAEKVAALSKSLEDATAAANAQAAIAQATADKRKDVVQQFVAQYGTTPSAYIQKAKIAAYGKTSKASGYQGRSAEGAYQTNNLSPTTSTSASVQAYHAAEDAAKLKAQKGDLVGAMEGYLEAEKLREGYQKFLKDKGHITTTDDGHAEAINTLQKRRASMSHLKDALDDTDPGVVSAKAEVAKFYLSHGTTSPYS